MPRASQGRRGPKRASEDLRATIEVLYSGIVTSMAPKRSLGGQIVPSLVCDLHIQNHMNHGGGHGCVLGGRSNFPSNVQVCHYLRSLTDSGECRVGGGS